MADTGSLLLVNLPFYSVHAPNYDISIIKSLLNIENIQCVIKYWNLDFSNQENYDLYSKVVNSPIEYDVANSFVFEELLGYSYQCKNIENEYIWQLQNSSIKSDLLDFLELKAKEITKICPKIILFSTKYMNLYISIYFAKIIKLISPNTIIILFGELVIGKERVRALTKRFDYIDLVIADKNFKKLINILKDLFSSKLSVGCFDDAKYIINDYILNDLPLPDYSDFFLHNNTNFFEPILLIEATRGCYWGKCKFCSAKGVSSNYDAKSIKNIIKEILYFTKKYKITKVEFIDICISPQNLILFCQEMSIYGYSIEYFAEMRVDFPVNKIKYIYNSGFKSIQVGIENFSTDLLKIINKGTSKIKNVEFLKFCMEANINVVWNFLYGFPEETDSHIDENIALINKILHLRPPKNVLMVRNEYLSDYYYADRFEIDYNDSSTGFCPSFNIKEKRNSNRNKRNNLIKLINDWQLNNYYKLEYSIGPDFVKIIKSGPTDSVVFVLIEWQGFLFLECKQIVNIGKLYNNVKNKYRINKATFYDYIKFLVFHNIVLKEGDNLLSLAIPT
jgi:hypothetical protein